MTAHEARQHFGAWWPKLNTRILRDRSVGKTGGVLLFDVERLHIDELPAIARTPLPVVIDDEIEVSVLSMASVWLGPQRVWSVTPAFEWRVVPSSTV